MPDETASSIFNMRLEPAERQRLEQIRARLEEVEKPHAISAKFTLMRGLDLLEKYLDKLERDRTRNR